MTGADPSPVDRKNLKLISNVEKTDKKNYEAVFNFNGIKEAIVSRRGPVLEIYKHWIVTILFYDWMKPKKVFLFINLWMLTLLIEKGF